MGRVAVFSLILAVLPVGAVFAQLPAVPEPPENPITEQKRVLGKILFWDEQLSSDNTVSCGTCHDPAHAGTDPRPGAHPGPDGTGGTDDDVIGSPGVVRRNANGDPIDDPVFGFDVQVTPRAANPAILSMFADEIFWDGRASSTFLDPESGAVSIASGGALESQAVAPILSSVEMASDGRTWPEVIGKLEAVTPLRFAADFPPDVAAALDVDPTYPELFEEAFGDPAITAERIAYAIATYERTLVPDQTPWDLFLAGDIFAMTPTEQAGWEAFQVHSCSLCHLPPLFTNNTFRNIGVRPVSEDIGRQAVTGVFADRGRFKVPSLRNLPLKTTFMHNGGIATIPEVVSFYEPGNQFTENLDPLLPIQLLPGDRPGVFALLDHGLVDPRVAAETFPFDHPSFFGGRDPMPFLFFEPDRVTLTWPAIHGVTAYRIYRGALSQLADGDEDGLPDGGYGDCVTDLDPDDTDSTFVDTEIPGAGQGFFYLKTIVDGNGEGTLGTTGGGLPRLAATPCP